MFVGVYPRYQKTMSFLAGSLFTTKWSPSTFMCWFITLSNLNLTVTIDISTINPSDIISEILDSYGSSIQD